MLTNLFTEIAPSLGVLLATVVSFYATKAIRIFERKTGLEIEARHREALHQALISGVQAALASGPKVAVEVIAQRAVEHAQASVPDAIAAIEQATGANLTRLANRYIRELGGA